ncbi:hypothetical protein [Alicyclobacillus dauci]|uniref:Uncharacterized protein n=1 Tax=Alicyclobacillus dauci TaxID=1475485 RepID=A0ABY6Z211_9BACL|nr:hypothetical protein [Alicyclobacillus dauci]WAH36727.1 hypothetical protein NZD86_21550 [Alicyclobacillus dauci]
MKKPTNEGTRIQFQGSILEVIIMWEAKIVDAQKGIIYLKWGGNVTVSEVQDANKKLDSNLRIKPDTF